MDFSKFRSSGDLSDITVIIENKDHKLHRFPLYARSDYFCELAHTNETSSENEVLELKDFPGGSAIFRIVADFCYNMPVEITKNNAVALRCAAQYLKMFGPGNLAEVVDNYLSKTLNNLQETASSSIVIKLILQSNAFGKVAKEAGVVDKCIDNIINLMKTKSIAFSSIGTGGVFARVTPRYQTSGSAFNVNKTSNAFFDDKNIKPLISLEAEWFADILKKASARNIYEKDLCYLAVEYINNVIEQDRNVSSGAGAQQDKPSPGHKEEDENEIHEINKDINNERDTTIDFEKEELSFQYVKRDEDIGYVLDTILLALTESALLSLDVSMDWITQVLSLASSKQCECRSSLVKLASEKLIDMDPEQLVTIPPDVLHDIVLDQTAVTENKAQYTKRACKIVDLYLSKLCSMGSLTSNTFELLVSATQSYSRTSHDSLFDFLEAVIASEQSTMTEERRRKLTEFIDLNSLSESRLQKALDQSISDPVKIANCALKMCRNLRDKLFNQDRNKIATLHTQRNLTEPDKLPSFDCYGQTETTSADKPDTKSTKSRSLTEETDDEQTRLSPRMMLPNNHLPQPSATYDHLRAAQNVLMTARSKLAVPAYTGYRQGHYGRASPLFMYPRENIHPGLREHDISIEDELEYRFDRSFSNSDPRARRYRLGNQIYAQQYASLYEDDLQRAYFPYFRSLDK